MTLKVEDPTKRKKWKKLRIAEVSTVDRGGHQMANILIARDDGQQEQKVTFFDKLMGAFRKQDDKVERGDTEQQPMTTTEILQARKAREEMYRVQSAFEESMWRILSCSKGKEQVSMLRKTVDEFGTEMETAFERSGAKDSDESMERIGHSLREVAEVLAKNAEGDELPRTEIERIERVLDPKNKPEGSGTSQEKNMTVKIEDVLRKLTDDERKVLEAELAKNKTEAKTADPVETIQRAANEGKLDPEIKSAFGVLTEQMKTLTTEIQRGNDANKQMVDRVARLEKEREDTALETAAAQYVSAGFPKDKVIDVLRSGGEAAKAILDAAKTRVDAANAKLFEEVGVAGTFERIGGTEGSASEEIERAAKDLLVKDDKGEFKGSIGMARDHVRQTKPDLAKRERSEMQRGAH